MLNPLYNSVACGCCFDLRYPSSPATVLLTEKVDNIYDNCVDLSLFKKLQSKTDIDQSSKNKRKREEN